MTKNNYFHFVLLISFLLLSQTSLQSQSRVSLGIDVLVSNKFKELKGKKVTLLTNTASTSNKGKKTVDIFVEQNVCNLQTIITPEHGLFTVKVAGEKVSDTSYKGIPVYSLYGSLRRPTKKILSNCDVIVIDIQDIGIRSYTYISTVYNVLDAAIEYSIPVLILDRPNPLGGNNVEGSVLDMTVQSFVGIAPIPYIHGMTIGEISMMFVKEKWLPIVTVKKNLTLPSISVLRMKGWTRSMAWEETKLQWTPTSPNIPDISSVRGCAITGIIGEINVVNIGIGSETPFQILGSPTIKNINFVQSINPVVAPSIQLMPKKFKPERGLFSKDECSGAFLKVSPKAKNLLQCFCEVLLHLRKYESKRFTKTFSKEKHQMLDKIMGRKNSLQIIQNGGKKFEAFLKEFRTTPKKFLTVRQKYLLYN